MTSTQLERRRDQAAAAGSEVETTSAAVTELTNRLRTNADLAQQQTQALRNAEAEAKRLKSSLKTQARDKARLTKAHEKAVARAAKAQSRATSAEAKYSKSVLADLVDKAKEQDRNAPAAAPATVTQEPVVAAAQPIAAEPIAAPVPTARATAARATATKAASTASARRTTSPRNNTATEATSTAAKRTPVRRTR